MGRTVKVVLDFEQRQIILVLTLVTWIPCLSSLSLWCFGPLSDGRHLSREGGMSGTRGIRAPGPILNNTDQCDQSDVISVRASPWDRWA